MPTDFNLPDSSTNKSQLNLSSLTAKQKKVFCAIENYIKNKGIPPTVREIGELVGEKTPGAVHGILNRLEQKGVINRKVGMARTIQLATDESQYQPVAYLPILKKINSRTISDIFNIYNVETSCPVPASIVSSNNSSFIIDCPDNSLMSDGIKYEDKLLIEKCSEFEDNNIVLILYENHLLLRYYFNSAELNSVILKASSNLLDKEIFDKTEVTIIGKLVGKYTTY